jgi:hypothetical protein
MRQQHTDDVAVADTCDLGGRCKCPPVEVWTRNVRLDDSGAHASTGWMPRAESLYC